jgi:arylsulfatase A-like enzyme
MNQPSPPTPSAQTVILRRRLAPVDVLLLAGWCGLAAGLLEVAIRVLLHSIDPSRMYLMNRHFVWLIPLSNSLLFAGLGAVLALATKLLPRAGGWMSPRLVFFWAVFPLLMVVSTRIYPLAWVIVALGATARGASILERHPSGLRRSLIVSFPGLLLLVVIAATSVFGGDWLKQRREATSPLPPADRPNVLLIVLDTVRADRLSVYGYKRRTSPTFERLASHGIRFDQSRATAPWTLPSHASFFTGRLPHELGIKWVTPLGTKFPTLAEYLGAHGYATAGFVANTYLCSYETGLARGFTHYEDYPLGRFGPLALAWLFDRALGAASDLGLLMSRSFDTGPFRPWLESLVEPLFVVGKKKDAETVNRAFLAWLSARREPRRPFFVFLNYFDAHAPYVLPRGATYRFGQKPESQADFMFLIEDWASIHNKPRLSPRYQSLVRDCYDNCLAYLDEQVGALINELERRGLLERTLLILAADHGEGLGEHELFDHGESLYRTEIGVPLVIVPPARSRGPVVVDEVASLRDLPATVVDLLDLEAGSPFPGRSLQRLWHGSSSGADAARAAEAPVISELTGPNPSDPNQGRSPAVPGPLVSLAQGDFVYIRNETDGHEELFNEREDPRELSNRAHSEALQSLVDRFRAQLNELRASRFKAVN